MGWKIEVLIVFKESRNNDMGWAERKLLDSYLGNWVYTHTAHRMMAPAGLA